MKKESFTFRFFILLFVFPNLLISADYFWIGGSGNWSDINHWATTSGGGVIHAVVPLPGDNVFFDANSGFTVGNNTVTIDVIANCHNMTWSGALNNPVITGSSSNELRLYGSIELQASMIYSVSRTNFLSNSPGETIRTNGTLVNGSFRIGDPSSASTGVWTLLDGLTTSSSLNFYSGTFITSNQSVSARDFSSSGNLSRSLTLGTSVMIMNVGGWRYTGSNSALSGASSRLIFTNGSSMEGDPGDVYNVLEFQNTSGSGTVRGGIIADSATFVSGGNFDDNNTITYVSIGGDGRIEGNNTFDTLYLSPAQEYLFEAGSTLTINDLFSAVAPPCVGLTELKSTSTTGSQATINFSGAAVANIDNAIVKDIQAIGNVPISALNSFDMGNNTNINFPASVGKTLYWVGGNGDWNDANHWSTVNDGVYPPVSGCIPTPLDDVVFNNNSGFTSGNKVQLTGVAHYCHNMTWIGALNTPEIEGAPSNPLSVYGSMTLQSDMIYDAYRTYFLSDNLGETITTNGTTVDGEFYFGDQGIASTGEWILQDDLTCTGSIQFYSGTLNTNSQTVTIREFRSLNSLSRSLTLGASTIIMNVSGWRYTGSNSILSGANSTLRFTSGATMEGDPGDVYGFIDFVNTSGTGTVRGSITARTINFDNNGRLEDNNIMDTLVLYPGHTYDLESASTQTITSKLYASGNPCFILFMESTSAGNQAFLNVSSGDTIFDYTNIRDINASGSYSSLFMERNSTNSGNNTNINFAPNTTTGLIGFGPDTVLPCPIAGTFTISTAMFFGTPATSYVWNDMTTLDSLVVDSFGQYFAQVNYGDGCIVSDTLNISPASGGEPVLSGNIIGDSTVCDSSMQVYTIDSVSPAASYTWTYSGIGTLPSTDTSITFYPTSNGTLSVTATNACGSSIPKNMNIIVSPIPTPSPFGGSLCIGDTLFLQPDSNGTWTSSAPAIASINDSGRVIALSAGVADMIYTDTATGCSSVDSLGRITVGLNTPPTGSGGDSSVCGGGYFIFPSRNCGGSSLRWYENDSAAGPFYTDSVIPTTTTTYYPFCFSSCLSPAGSPAIATVTCYPTVTTGSNWTWTGCADTDWFNKCNWDRGSIPDGTSTVTVPLTGNQPVIANGTAICFDIIIQTSTGASVELQSTNSGIINILKP